MLKTVTAGATALMLIAGVSAYAQQPPAGTDFGRRQLIAPEDRAAFLDGKSRQLATIRSNTVQTPLPRTDPGPLPRIYG